MVNLLYQRTISIARPSAFTAAPTGVEAVQEFTTPQLAILASSLCCSIQIYSGGGKPLGNVAGDTRARGTWTIVIPMSAASAAGLGATNGILDRDEITDDAAAKYQVTQAEWSLLSWTLSCERLEA